ncbi:MAG: diguanylate cyclase [Gammaproteobacteria bacterium]|nr:diguanylate cyclase [Gammaproteobacteria bacterium]
MTQDLASIKEFHWLIDMIQNLDVGLVVIDRELRVQVWNTFMENHSGCSPTDIIGNKLLDFCRDIPADWFKRKVESVFLLNHRAFTTWEQRPYLFKFKNYRPITGIAEFMYQDVTLIPLTSADGEVKQVGILVYDVTDMAMNKRELQSVNHSLESLSRTDHLTQLNNRGYWEEQMQAEFARFQRSKRPSTLVMFDIDHFKQVNDNYGHQAGDEVIRITAQQLTECKRNTDIAGRYGGEEFVVILDDTTAKSSMIFAERLRKKIEALIIEHECETIKFTISLGLAEFDPLMNDYHQAIEYADQALYKAKQTGRNRSVIYDLE